MLANSQYFARKPDALLNNYILFTLTPDKINTMTLLFKNKAKPRLPGFASVLTYFTSDTLNVRDWQGRNPAEA